MAAIIEFAPPRVPDPAWAIERVLSAPVAAMGFEVVTVRCAGSKNRPVVRVYLDRAGDDRISLDDCARMTPIISNALDAAEADPDDGPGVASVLGRGYTLEVSSPGVERPLAKRAQFDAVVGRRILVKTYGPLDDDADRQKRFHGFVVGTEIDPEHPDDPRSGAVHLRELDSERDLWISLPRIKDAHLVHED
jgi:ribosome maturation factor RimP